MGAPRQPLEGIRVLDLGQVWAGPQLGLFLADFGADVVLIETDTRTAMQASTLRFTAYSPDGTREVVTDREDPRSYNALGRNRRCLSLNLQEPRGREIFLQLAAVSDVVFDNYSPRGIQNLDIGYDVLREVNPRLIVASLSAAGQYGPWSDVVTYGPSLTALFGYKSLLGYPGDGAVMEDVSDLDPTAAAYGVLPILAALRARKRTGRGQFIDLAQGEAGMAHLAEAVIEYTANGRVLGPTGNRHRTHAPRGVFPAAGTDRWISISVQDDAQWRALCEVLGVPALAADARFVDAAARLRNVDALEVEVGRLTGPHEAAELAAKLQAAGVAALPVLDALGVVNDDQLDYRRRVRFEPEDSPVDSGDVLVGMPWILSRSRPALRRPSRPIGADNEAVLGELLGLSPEEVAGLAAAGVLA